MIAAFLTSLVSLNFTSPLGGIVTGLRDKARLWAQIENDDDLYYLLQFFVVLYFEQ